jgi:hypothetical protein
MPIDWSVPLKEGWEVFDSSERGLEIERVDEATFSVLNRTPSKILSSDDEALRCAESFLECALRLYPEEIFSKRVRELATAIETSRKHLRGENLPPPAKLFVHVLVIETKHGGGGSTWISAYRTAEALNAALAGYVRDEWENQIAGALDTDDVNRPPENPEDMVACYTEMSDGDFSYVTDVVEVEG